MRSKGFTLVELIIVIVLLGILSAFAIPKFINLTSKASAAVTENMFASLRVSLSLAHAQWIAKGKPNSITMQGSVIPMTATGWPGVTHMSSDACRNIFHSIMESNANTSGHFNTQSENIFVYGSDKTCSFADVHNNPSRMMQYNTQTGKIEETFSGD